MDVSAILLAVILMLGSTVVCVLLFEQLGFGSVLGLIVAGILIGPHTPGPVVTDHVDELQHVAEIGVVLLMFTIGLELRPKRLWRMRRLIFGLGSAQMLLTTLLVGTYAFYVIKDSWQTSLILGFGFAMSSTAIVMTLLEKKGDLPREHGQGSFAILMAQDLWIVPIMALIPILGSTPTEGPGVSAWQELALVGMALAVLFLVGRFLLPAALAYTAERRNMEAFGAVVYLTVLAAAWMMEQIGISMTLGALLIGMLLSASDYRHQIEAITDPFKGLLMGLFFVAVGMSIDVPAFLANWQGLLVHVPAILVIKIAVLVALALAFGISRPAAFRIGGLLSQAGEFAFVLFGAAAALGLMSDLATTLSILGVAISMILTPLSIKVGNTLASRLGGKPDGAQPLEPSDELERHVVIVGCEERGRLVALMLERSGIPYIAFDRDSGMALKARSRGRNALPGDILSPVTQRTAGLSRAKAVFLSSRDPQRTKSLAVTLRQLYPTVDIYAMVPSIEDQTALRSRGIRHAGTDYIESTLLQGSRLLRNLGQPDDDIGSLVETLQKDDYAALRARTESAG
ncbi:MAG: cation:proton antiporter [Desulfuromonadales bacterium]|jgi:glutathione-regulated potassium-efflux system ancillary protein KefC